MRPSDREREGLARGRATRLTGADHSSPVHHRLAILHSHEPSWTEHLLIEVLVEVEVLTSRPQLVQSPVELPLPLHLLQWDHH